MSPFSIPIDGYYDENPIDKQAQEACDCNALRNSLNDLTRKIERLQSEIETVKANMGEKILHDTQGRQPRPRTIP